MAVQDGRHIAVIGAGFAGISSLRVLRELGFKVTVFEKDHDVGGVWAASRRYPGLTTQNPGSTYHLSEHPMPADYPEWPTGKQMQDYFESYIEAFDLGRNISLSTEVRNARQLSDGKWQLTVVSEEGGAEEAGPYDFLIVANGIFSRPMVPSYPGQEQFLAGGGQILHTSQFTDPALANGRNVLVIGYGKSSCDVAFALKDRAQSVSVIARNLIWKIPKKVGNILNFKHLFLTRMGEGLFRYIEIKGIERFLHGPFGKPIRNLMLGSVERVVGWQLRLRKIGLHPGKKLETIARSTVSLVTDGFYEGVDAGTIRVEKGSEIVRLENGFAILQDGKKLPADLIVAGTGWIQEVPFFEDEINQQIFGPEGDFRLYKSMVPVGVKNLAFNGYNSSFFSQLNCEIGALWIADLLHGGIRLPTEEVQDRWIDKRLAWMRERTDGKHSRGTNIIPFSMHHIDELLNDMNLNLSSMKRLGQWFNPVNPGSYRHLLGRLKARHAGRIEALQLGCAATGDSQNESA